MLNERGEPTCSPLFSFYATKSILFIKAPLSDRKTLNIMKILTLSLVVIFFIFTVSLKAENAPVTTVGTIINATTVPGSTIVPVTVKNFAGIGSFTLTLLYNSSLVTYVSFAPHASFPGMTITNTIAGSNSTLVINWPQTPGGVTLPDETHLLDMTFTYLSGTSTLSWYDYDVNVCEYTRYSGGSYIVLNDSPQSSYYINGGISNRGAPVTYAPFIGNATPGAIAVPITVNNFTSVGAMSLTLEYNQSVLTYVSCVKNPAIGGTFSSGAQMGPNGKMIVTISWFGNASLANGSTVVTINFNYSVATGTYSSLEWYDNGPSCQYADALGNGLLDSPVSDFYQNGAVYKQYSPQVWLPAKTNAIPSGTLALPAFVKSFNNVRSFTLSYEYDPAVMTYSSFTPDAAFGSALTAADSQSGSKRKLVLTWTGTANKTLPDGSLLGTMNFTYLTGTSTLAWITNDLTSCRFNDANGKAYYDLPKTSYYQDGLVASHPAPRTAAGQLSGTSGQPVTVPLKVYDFTNIGLFNLTLDYDPAVLTYQSASLVPSIGGTFTATTSGIGRVIINWSGTTGSLADGSTLVNLTFTYNGGSTPLAWFDDGNSCRYAESGAGPSLYDLPRASYYINGYVGPNPLEANFTANANIGDLNMTFVLTDQTTGSPTAWNWTISPSSFYFVNGTTASSQNPQIRFTSDSLYTVTLVASRGMSAAIRIKKEWLQISTLVQWTGLTSSDWTDGSNWQNLTVPTATTKVVIPATAPNWPHLTGGLTLGVQCKNITMEGAAYLYVDGDITINAGSSLNFTGSGTLFLGGSWMNLGSWNTGTSTIVFIGPNDAYILGGANPETFWKIIASKTNATITVGVDVNVIGTENK
jgi:hypothetical protein